MTDTYTTYSTRQAYASARATGVPPFEVDSPEGVAVMALVEALVAYAGTNGDLMRACADVGRTCERTIEQAAADMHVNSSGVLQQSAHDVDRLCAERALRIDAVKRTAWLARKVIGDDAVRRMLADSPFSTAVTA